MKKLFLIVAAVLSLTACTAVSTEVTADPVITHSAAEAADHIELIIYDSGTANAKGGSWTEFRFPKIYAGSNDAITAEILNVLNRSVIDRVAEAEAQAKEAGAPATGWEFEFEIKVADIYSDSNLLIVNFAGYEYFGTAHGVNFKWTMAFDAKTGEQLSLREQFADEQFAEVLDLVAQELEWAYEDSLFETGAKLRAELAKINDVEAWSIDSSGLGLVLPAYAVTAGYAGEPEVKIGWSSLKNLLVEDSLLRQAFPVQMNSECKEAFPGIDLTTCE